MGGKDSIRRGRAEKHSIFRIWKLDEDGSGGDFETSYAKADTPVKLLDAAYPQPQKLKSGIIKRIHYRINPTNAVTYTLRLYRKAEADNYASNMNLLYESPAGQADDTDYDITELEIPMRLYVAGQLFFALEWTGAAGTTSGFIEVSGEVIE